MLHGMASFIEDAAAGHSIRGGGHTAHIAFLFLRRDVLFQVCIISSLFWCVCSVTFIHMFGIKGRIADNHVLEGVVQRHLCCLSVDSGATHVRRGFDDFRTPWDNGSDINLLLDFIFFFSILLSLSKVTQCSCGRFTTGLMMIGMLRRG